MKILQLVAFIFVSDIVLYIFGRYTLWFGRKTKKIGMSVLKDGVVPPGGSLFGRPEVATEVPRIWGYGMLYASFFGYLFAWLSFIAIPIFTVGFPLSVFLATR